MTLGPLFTPKGVAIIGSASEGKLGYVLTRQIVSAGYRGPLFLVNPKGKGALSVPGYRSVAEIGAEVDLAVVASPAPTVPDVLEDCGRAGVKVAVVITAGFSEVGNVEGEEAIKEVARRYGVRVVGPNCAGFFNNRLGLHATLEIRPPVGEVALVSQSGALGGAVLAWAEEQGLGFSKFVSYGNRADVGEVDLLAYLAEDPEAKVVALYIESVEDGRAFLEAAHAFTRHKPLVVIKAGRGQAGRRAALSHTGSMAGSDAVYDAALRQVGALRVETVEEMFDLCKGLVHLPPVKGRRVAIVTNSGGPGVLAADRAETVGLEVAEPSDALKERLSAFLPPYCSLRNPFDLTVEGTEDGYRETLKAVLEEYDAALALDVCPPYLDSAPHARGVCDAAETTGKPVVANFMAGRTVEKALPVLRERGVPDFPTGERAVTVLARLAEYEERKARWRPLPEVPQERRRLPGEEPLLEPEAMAWLRENGIPTLDFRFATTAEEAVEAARDLGYPVVMKVVSPHILHKSDVGGVVLNVADDQQALETFVALQRVAADLDFRGVVVYPMVRGMQEVILGLSRDPQFGPVVLFGLGGIYTEVLHDVALRIAPIDRPEAEEMIREIRAYPLLTGVRGQPPCDLETLADVLVRFSRLPFLYPEVAEVDLNPVFVSAEGVWVGDVRVIRNKVAGEQGGRGQEGRRQGSKGKEK